MGSSNDFLRQQRAEEIRRQQKEFARRIQEILDKLRSNNEGLIRDVLAALNDARDDIAHKLLQTGRTEFDLSVLRAAQGAIDQRIRELQQDLQRIVSAGLVENVKLGIESVDRPLGAISTFVSPPAGLSRNLALIAPQFSATMVRNITSEIQSAVDSALRRMALGQISISEAMNAIAGSGIDKSIFRTPWHRAETILRTDGQRITEIAANERKLENREATRRAGYDLLKRWYQPPELHPRGTHTLAMLTYVSGIPLDDPFIVGGEPLMFPRDPNGSAGNTINCHCSSFSVIVPVGSTQSFPLPQYGRSLYNAFV